MRSLFILLPLLAALLAACAPFQPYRQSAAEELDLQVVKGVPFHAQRQTRDCGPAALTSILRHRGHPASVAEVEREIYDPRVGGTLIADMENYTRSLGFQTASGNGSLGMLRSEVDAGRPVIILADYGVFGRRSPHYLVIYGYGKEHFLAHVGIMESALLEAEDLDQRWAKMNRLYLVLE